MKQPRGARHQGGFGSLDNGTARPVLSPTALTDSVNTEHHHGGAITKRPGRCVQGEIASQASPACPPNVMRQTTDDNGTLVEGQTYYVRSTYVTAAGETDDLYNQRGEPTTEWVVDAGRTSAQVTVPFHLRDVEIGEVGETADGHITIRLVQPDPAISIQSPVQVCDPAIFVGWLVYPRSPRLTDETNLGTNCEASEPLYHRTVPFARVTFYDQDTQTFTLDRISPERMGLTGFIDRDRVDIMMPDRAGLPILAFKVYSSDDGENFFYAATGVRGDMPVNVLGVDEDAQRAPSTRTDRSAPTISAVDVRAIVPGQCGRQLVNTNLPAGLYEVRTTWTTGDIDLLKDPDYPETRTLLDEPQSAPVLRCEQETHPSRAAYVTILDGQGIEVTPAPGPEINSGWNLYGRQIRPFQRILFTDSLRTYGEGVVDPFGNANSPQNYGYSAAIYYGNQNVPDASFPGTELFTESPQDSCGLANRYDEFYDTSLILSTPLDPFASATRGFRPGYPDINFPEDADQIPEFAYASSRDSIRNNRMLFWFHLDTVDQAYALGLATHAVFRLQLRARPGKTDASLASGGAVYVAGDSEHVNIRCWDEGGTAWTTLRSGLGATGWFRELGFPIEWDAGRLIVGETLAGVPTTARFLVFDVTAFNSVGFDVTDVALELYSVPLNEEDDFVSEPDCVLQRGGIEPITDDSYTLKNPLAVRTYILDDPTNVGTGEWESIRPNTTAQWPVVVVGLPVVGKAASSPETKVNFIGCADSCFRDLGDGSFERIFQIEGDYWNSCLYHDWRFENYLNRVFFLNEGDPRWNYRFDGLATYPMGLPKPVSGVTEEDISEGFGTGSGEIPALPVYTDGCVEQEFFAGQIIEVNETDVLEGEELDGEAVRGFDLEYYIVYKRRDPATGRSYVVRSEPAQLTRTRRVRGTSAFPPSIIMEGWLCPEPQVTHIEIYRNSFLTADYYLVSDIVIGPDGTIPDYSNEGIRITDDIIDPATGRIHFLFEDSIPPDGSDLTLPIEWDTGRPTAAVMMKFNRGRIFFVQQKEREILAWTNITSPSGDINPEGFCVQHVQEPPVAEAAAITCLSVYHDIVVVSCNTGMVGVQGISDRLNSGDALSFSALATDGGWMGPDAWVNVDNIQYGMTRQGPGWLAGEELNFVGPPIEGTLYRMILTTDAGFDCRCTHYRDKGRTQVWFTFKDDTNGCISKCLVFDEGVSSGADREQFWKEWHQMPVHGLSTARDSDGNEYPILGGSNGRTYRHGLHGTDAGLLIEHDLATRPFEAPSPSVAFEQRWAYFYTTGEPEDVTMLDVRADLTEVAMNQHPIPIRMGGDCGLSWAEAVGGDPNDKWGGSGERPYVSEKIPLGGLFQQIQYRLYMDWDVWPVGAARCTTFETTGFDPFQNFNGPRPARANATRSR